jgi:hypothetical protein
VGREALEERKEAMEVCKKPSKRKEAQEEREALEQRKDAL